MEPNEIVEPQTPVEAAPETPAEETPAETETKSE
jgi:hypothetical protein